MLDLLALRAPGSLPALPPAPLGFGRVLGPFALVADHDPERGFHGARIVRREEATTVASAASVQYALSVFEGLKALRGPSGALHLWRPEPHARRFAKSSERLTMPVLPEAAFLDACRAIVKAHEGWVPAHGKGSLYLRPTLYATEEFLGVRPSRTHQLAIVVSAVDAFYSSPLRLWAETEHVRAAPGGLGDAKTGANYAASLHAAERAKKRGFDQVLWLDAHDHDRLAEAGTMNVFVVIDGAVRTPELDGTILPGVTRDACLALLRARGVKCEEAPISLREVHEAAKRGALTEAFGTGTAAIVAPIAAIGSAAGVIELRAPGEVATTLRAGLEAIQQGVADDPFGWRVPV
ncbi:branched-chain amino acid aminotransferase [Sandaracinus amylolyticus]|uniref:Branched-chain-amino-acid aminotransferase n=1 Tax=Sandaracinus amylolyticus TaxID=927083 RepID=A0A0F6W6Q8_9BACT|nr:branched-chain amino acid aminotransferase [Sandaracinus amylolyticus]AKF08918.1 Branched-chain amino acid aminotransferase [Sandaracinus amylolyticus]